VHIEEIECPQDVEIHTREEKKDAVEQGMDRRMAREGEDLIDKRGAEKEHMIHPEQETLRVRIKVGDGRDCRWIDDRVECAPHPDDPWMIEKIHRIPGSDPQEPIRMSLDNVRMGVLGDATVFAPIPFRQTG